MGRGRERVNRFLDKWLDFGKFPGSELGGLDTGFRHKTYYHKHFQGFTEIRRVGKHGRIVIERRYTAPWQRHRLTDAQWVLTKLAYILGVLISTVLFLWSLAQPIPTNRAALVAAPGFLTGFLLLLMWMSVFTYVSAPRNMTLWEHRSGKGKIERFTRLTFAAVLATAAAKVIYICVWMDFSWTGEVGSLLAMLGAAAPLILIYAAEHRMGYEELENEDHVTEEERYDIQ